MSLIRFNMLDKIFYPKKIKKIIVIKKILLPIFTFAFYFIFVRDISGVPSNDALLGLLAVYTGVSSSFFNLITLCRIERISGITELVVASPKSNLIILLEKATLVFLEAIVSTNINFLIIGLFFNIPIFTFFNINIQIILVFFAAQYMLLSCNFIILTMYIDNINLFLNLFLSAIQILSGIFFPVSVFGPYLENVLLSLPLVNLLSALRIQILGSSYSYNTFHIFSEVWKILILIIILLITNNVIMKQALKRGTILNQ